MKKSLLFTVVLSLIVSSSSFGKNIKGEGSKKITKAAPVLSSAEQEFLNEIDNYYYLTFEKPANDLTLGIEKENNRKVKVIDIEGNIITEEVADVPANANFLMEEENTIFYIVN